jgi:uncharacterized protein (TIGR02246 family)
MSVPSWVVEVFSAVDSQDPDAFVSFLTEDCTFVYANQPHTSGREAIREGVAGFFQTIAGLDHNIVRTWIDGDTVICQLTVTYTRIDNQQRVTVPAVTIWDMVGDKIARYLVYVDLTPVYAPAE